MELGGLHQGAIRRQAGEFFLNDPGGILRHVVQDRFIADFDATGWLGRVQVAELEKQRPGGFHDLLGRGIGGLVHAAFVARKPDHAGNPRAPCRRLGSPQDFIGITAVRGSPDIGNIEGTLDSTGANLRAKKPVH